MSTGTVVVYGASGHTGRLVVRDLTARGHDQIVLAGRDGATLRAVGDEFAPAARIHVAGLDDPDGLSELLTPASVVINCAGPFAHSGVPIASAAIAAGCHYLDHAAEPMHVKGLFDTMQQPAADNGVVLVPGMSFYGAVADLLADVVTEAMPQVERVTVAYAVSGWRMTAASKTTALRLVNSERLAYTEGEFRQLTSERAAAHFDFPAPIGRRPVLTEYPTGEMVTIPRHVQARSVETLMTVDTFREDAVFTSEHIAPADRAQSEFTLVVQADNGDDGRRGWLRGNDIYQVGARVAVEAALRLARDPAAVAPGVRSAAEAFAAKDFLASIDELAGFTITSEPG